MWLKLYFHPISTKLYYTYLLELSCLNSNTCLKTYQKFLHLHSWQIDSTCNRRKTYLLWLTIYTCFDMFCMFWHRVSACALNGNYYMILFITERFFEVATIERVGLSGIWTHNHRILFRRSKSFSGIKIYYYMYICMTLI